MVPCVEVHKRMSFDVINESISGRSMSEEFLVKINSEFIPYKNLMQNTTSGFISNLLKVYFITMNEVLHGKTIHNQNSIKCTKFD